MNTRTEVVKALREALEHLDNESLLSRPATYEHMEETLREVCKWSAKTRKMIAKLGAVQS